MENRNLIQLIYWTLDKRQMHDWIKNQIDMIILFIYLVREKPKSKPILCIKNKGKYGLMNSNAI